MKLTLDRPRTPTEIEELRAKMEKHYSPHIVYPDVLTCDNCKDVAICTCAFDPWNTRGDCLAEK